jgi:poly(A) polymerase
MLARRMDEMEARINELMASEELASLRPELDGQQVMELLDVPAGPIVGAAMEFLMDIRLEEGILGEEQIVARLHAWWESNKDKASSLRPTRRINRG